MSADDFAALEHATPIVQVADGVATTTSMRIANGTQVQHKNLRELIEDNLPDFEEFGRVRFETAKPPEGTNGGRSAFTVPELFHVAEFLGCTLADLIPQAA